MQERIQYLADAARLERQKREESGQNHKDSQHLRDYFEAGYALLNAARLHGYELPVENSNNSFPVIFQSSMDLVAEKLAKQDPALSTIKFALIFSTAEDIIAINHLGEETSSAEILIREFNEARVLQAQRAEVADAIDAASRIIEFHNK